MLKNMDQIKHIPIFQNPSDIVFPLNISNHLSIDYYIPLTLVLGRGIYLTLLFPSSSYPPNSLLPEMDADWVLPGPCFGQSRPVFSYWRCMTHGDWLTGNKDVDFFFFFFFFWIYLKYWKGFFLHVFESLLLVIFSCFSFVLFFYFYLFIFFEIWNIWLKDILLLVFSIFFFIIHCFLFPFSLAVIVYISEICIHFHHNYSLFFIWFFFFFL